MCLGPSDPSLLVPYRTHHKAVVCSDAQPRYLGDRAGGSQRFVVILSHMASLRTACDTWDPVHHHLSAQVNK